MSEWVHREIVVLGNGKDSIWRLIEHRLAEPVGSIGTFTTLFHNGILTPKNMWSLMIPAQGDKISVSQRCRLDAVTRLARLADG